MIDAARVERHLARTHASARVVRVGRFALHLHPTSAEPSLNVILPDAPTEGKRVPIMHEEAKGVAGVPDEDDAYAILVLKAQARAARRRPRAEFVSEAHPDLPALLRVAGFARAQTTPILACHRDAWRPAPAPEGLTFEPILPTTPWATLREFLLLQRDAYALAHAIPREAPPDAWAVLGIGAGVLASLHGRAIAAAGVTPPQDGLVEVRGLAVARAHRRGGIGAFLLNALARVVHEGGVDAALAFAETDAAMALARRAGYEPIALLEAWEAPLEV